MRKVLWWLIGGSRGGRNRLRIITTLDEEPMNANQLADDLDLNYKTVRHHLELLEENDVVTTMGGDYGTMYFLSDRMEENMDVLASVAEQAGLDDVVDESAVENAADEAGDRDE
ncbi:MAG TPA: winged helix-turn-helix domain-containing protein [Natrialbaceae archaeon]|nr:winged helix-turn-helix domain-containing protein [Natrialbaceae archaeon]